MSIDIFVMQVFNGMSLFSILLLMLVHASALMARGVDTVTACRMAIVLPVTDDLDMAQALEAAVAASF